ncbi:MAG: aminopeptidase P family protein [Candidatus Tectomicrobia bacterium]|nr:aminopeptidase P family protein [Candidatus Tectomicrobia bacterium]
MPVSVSPISRSEYEARRKRLAESCQRADLKGALVWSRQGTASDRAGYALYLANYYTEFFFLNDFPPHWACRGHSAAVVPAQGEAALVKDCRYYEAEQVAWAIDDVRQDFNLDRAIVATLLEKGLDRGRVGVIGSEVAPWIHFQEIQRALPRVEWVPADDLLVDQMLVKSEAELDIIRQGCAIVSDVTDEVLEAAEPGVSEVELVGRMASGLAERGAQLGWMRPNRPRRLERGDLYPMAVIGWCQGYFFDVSRSKVVGGKPTPQQARLLDLLKEFVLRQVEELRPGRTASEAAQFGYRYFIDEKKELTREQIEAGVLGEYACFGHGLGLIWSKPNLREGDETVLRTGMYLAVEAVYPKPGVGKAEAEVNVEITEAGPRVLTRL